MSKRNTGSGLVLEAMILPALRLAGYTYRTRVDVGNRLGLGRHVVDVLAERAGARHLVSLKWQQVSGTAEQKVPFEAICLSEALDAGGFATAYLVLGGEGWRFRGFFTSGGLTRYLRTSDRVRIVTLEAFVAQVNREGL